jgi:hypothetical protein
VSGAVTARPPGRVGALLAGLCLALAVTGCTITRPPRVAPAGFLGDYSRLRTTGADEAVLVYLNPALRLRDYDRIVIDPVTVWRADGATLGGVPPDELQAVVATLSAATRHALEGEYEIVERPGPRTLRVRVALTETEGAGAVLDLASPPPTRVPSGSQRLAPGTAALVTSAGIESEILDSLTGQRLMASVDRRAGPKRLKDGADTWDDVANTFVAWAERLRTRLARERGR